MYTYVLHTHNIIKMNLLRKINFDNFATFSARHIHKEHMMPFKLPRVGNSYYSTKNSHLGTREIVGLIALAGLPKNLHSIPSAHMVTQSHL